LVRKPRSVDATGWSRPGADLEAVDVVVAQLESLAPDSRPDVVINAAAYTAVDKAETDEARASAVNGTAVGRLARWCRENDALFVHYSTDYVFDGSGERPWLETDAPAPLGAYGRSKLIGEREAIGSGAAVFLFRTSWVFASEGQNFLRTMIRLGGERETLSVVDDQWGAPTRADDLADATWTAVAKFARASPAERARLVGVYHICGSGPATTWRGFAEAIFSGVRALGLPLKLRSLRPVSTAEYAAPAPRPLNSRLSCDKFAQTFDFKMPSWDNALKQTLEAMHERHVL
jgi:dTDP-4-dehydrorhamnose reductase